MLSNNRAAFLYLFSYMLNQVYPSFQFPKSLRQLSKVNLLVRLKNREQIGLREIGQKSNFQIAIEKGQIQY